MDTGSASNTAGPIVTWCRAHPLILIVLVTGASSLLGFLPPVDWVGSQMKGSSVLTRCLLSAVSGLYVSSRIVYSWRSRGVLGRRARHVDVQ
jgi:hypothetical protein